MFKYMRIFWIGFSSIFVFVGLGIALYGFMQIQAAQASKSWPMTTGTVVYSEMGRHRNRESGTSYSAEVEYEYRVDGELLSNNRIQFGNWNHNKASSARKVLNRYKKGTEVTVHYNPEDPYEAVLEPGVQAETWFLPIFGSAFAVFGMVFVAVGIFMMKNDPLETVLDQTRGDALSR